MADFNLTNTWSEIDTTVTNADAGGIGATFNSFPNGSDLNAINGLVNGFFGGFFSSVTSAQGWPWNKSNVNAVMLVKMDNSTRITQELHTVRESGSVSNMKYIRVNYNGTWSTWREIYHDNGNGVTAAQAATAIKGAKDGNIGVASQSQYTGDLNDLYNNGFYDVAFNSPNNPTGGSSTLMVMTRGGTSSTQLISRTGTTLFYMRTSSNGAWGDWKELYHTGNTGNVQFDIGALTGGEDIIGLSTAGVSNYLQISQVDATNRPCLRFLNTNGQVGSINVSGTTTIYNTSSDNRLKSVIGKPTDEQINAKFDDIYDTFTLFNWNNSPDGEAVWGFLAHDVIDKGLDFGSEGEGPRNLNIGDVYETIPEETEERPILDEDGNETGEFETVVVKEAIEKRVTPAGVDQSKITAYLVPALELERRRNKELQSRVDNQDKLITDLMQRLDAAGL